MKRFYTVKEVAKLLGFSTNTVYKYLDEGKIKSRRVGKEGRFRIPASELSSFLPSDSNEDITQTSKTSSVIGTISKEQPVVLKMESAPSLFDWFTFVLAIALGLSQFLFPTYVLDVNFQKYALLIKILKGSLVIFGGLLIVDDIFSIKRKSWHEVIHFVLAICFLSISLLLLKTNYFLQLVGYLTLGISLIVLRFWKLSEYGKYLLLINLNFIFFALISIFIPEKSGLQFISDWILSNRGLFISIVVLLFIACSFVTKQAIKGVRTAMFLISLSVCLFGLSYSIFAFSLGFWERAVYLVVLSAFSVIFPFSSSFERFIIESRQQLLLAFFWLNALFAVGAITLFFLGRSFEGYLLSEVEKRLDTASEITESFVVGAEDKIVIFSQDIQLLSYLEDGKESSIQVQEILKDFFLTEGGVFRRIVFSNAEGINVNLYPEIPESLGLDVSDIDSFKLAKEGRRVVNSGIVQPRTKNVPAAILITAPVYSRSGDFLGVLAGSLDLVELNKRLHQIKFGQSGTFKIADSKKNYVIHPNPDRVLKKASDDAAASLAVDGKKGVKKAYDTEGVLSLMAYKNISPLGWGIVAQQPLAESFGQYSTLGFVIFIILVMSGVTSLIIIIKSKKMINT